MFGRRIYSQPRKPTDSVKWFILSGVLAAGSFAMVQNYFLVLSILPLLFGLVALLTPSPALEIVLEDDGIEVLQPSESFIPYSSIQELTESKLNGKLTAFSVRHDEGSLDIFTPIQGMKIIELFSFIEDQMPEEPVLGVPPKLAGYIQRLDEHFGQDSVLATRSIAGPKPRKNYRMLFYSFALGIVGVFWCIIANADPDLIELMVVGFLSVMTFIILLLGQMIQSQAQSHGKGSDGGLVISPLGIAYESDQHFGSILWEEINTIFYKKKENYLHIRVDGGELKIMDIYDCHLKSIVRMFIKFWEGKI